MSDSFSIESLMPKATPAYMLPAWLSFVYWAIGKEEIVQQFRSDTNNQWRPATNAVDEMIDQATGADQAFLVAFINWLNVTHWGDTEDGE